MSQYANNRLPYDEPATPHQMAHDCRAVGDYLRSAEARTLGAARPRSARTAAHWKVSDSAARFAGGLHLHLN